MKSFMSLVVLLLASAGQVTSVGLGVACDSTNVCTDTTNHYCDATTKTCLIKVGKDCASNTDKCVTGATCANSICDDCSVASYTKDSTNLICTFTAKAQGGTCTAGAGACDDTNGECVGTPTLCTCKANFYTDSSKACAATATVGTACDTTSKFCTTSQSCDSTTNTCLIRVDNDCSGNTDKCVTGATCVTSGSDMKCSCTEDGYSKDATTLTCSGGAAVSLSVVMLVMATLVSLLTTRH